MQAATIHMPLQTWILKLQFLFPVTPSQTTRESSQDTFSGFTCTWQAFFFSIYNSKILSSLVVSGNFCCYPSHNGWSIFQTICANDGFVLAFSHPKQKPTAVSQPGFRPFVYGTRGTGTSTSGFAIGSTTRGHMTNDVISNGDKSRWRRRRTEGEGFFRYLGK